MIQGIRSFLSDLKCNNVSRVLLLFCAPHDSLHLFVRHNLIVSPESESFMQGIREVRPCVGRHIALIRYLQEVHLP